MVILSAEQLTYDYSADIVGVSSGFKLRCRSFAVEEKKNVYIVGPNGSGKSTLISLLSGERRPTSGVVKSNQGRLQKFTTVTLHAHDHELLIGNLTVCEHIIGALELNGGTSRKLGRGTFYSNDCKRITDAFTAEYITKFLSDTVATQVRFLSSGQRQLLVLLLLTIDRSFGVIFADEPTSHLDNSYAEAFYTAITSMEAATVIVTHNLDAACERADQIYVVDDGNVLALDEARAHTGSLSAGASKIVAYLDIRLNLASR